jgi:hypothetical protein
MEQFRGVIRIWRCSWSTDRNDDALPMSVAVSVLEYRYIDEGNESWRIAWKYPFRHDLTPDFLYQRCDEIARVIIAGNDSGARAYIYPPRPLSSQDQADLYGFLRTPVFGFREGIRSLLSDVEFRVVKSPVYGCAGRTGEDGCGLWSISSLSGLTEYSRGKHTIRDVNGRRDYTVDVLTKRSPEAGNQIEGPPYLANCDVETDSLLCAVDVAEEVHSEKKEWDSHAVFSGRVIQWQDIAIPSSIGKVGFHRIPRVVATEDRRKMVRNSAKDYCQKAIVLVDVIPDERQGLVDDWRRIFPGGLRVVDVAKGDAYVTAKDEGVPIARQWIDELGSHVDTFASLLTSDLRTRFQDTFLPVTQRVGLSEDNTSFSDIVQMNRRFCALGTGNVLSQFLPKVGDGQPSVLLQFVDRVRVAATPQQRSYTRQPKRAGYEPVTDEVRRRYRPWFWTVMTVAGSAAVLSVMMCFRRNGG